MIPLRLSAESTGSLRILCLGCHSDDIEIGCGGTLLRLVEQYPHCTFHWVVFSAKGIRQLEAERAAHSLVGPDRLKNIQLKAFPDGFMPFVGAEIKAVFEEVKRGVSPDLIFTHNRDDAHQDHRLIAEMTWNTFRDHLILEYEIPKYDGDMGRPSIFVPLTTELCERKMRVLMDAFESQKASAGLSPKRSMR